MGSPTQYLLYYEDATEYDLLDAKVKEHLESNREFLENRATVKNEGRDWWKYSRPMHKEYYKYNKIWCSYRGTCNKFSYDNSGECIGFTNTTAIFDNNPEINILYILGLVNSELLEYQHKRNAKQTGGGVYEYFPNTIERYPIELSDKKTRDDVVKIVKEILDKKNHGDDTSILENEIDKIVYRIYDIADNERRIIEGVIKNG